LIGCVLALILFRVQSGQLPVCLCGTSGGLLKFFQRLLGILLSLLRQAKCFSLFLEALH